MIREQGEDKQWVVGEIYEEKPFFASQEQRLDCWS